jgi:hypothetical protein
MILLLTFLRGGWAIGQTCDVTADTKYGFPPLPHMLMPWHTRDGHIPGCLPALSRHIGIGYFAVTLQRK